MQYLISVLDDLSNPGEWAAQLAAAFRNDRKAA
jgi:hypothetical protein